MANCLIWTVNRLELAIFVRKYCKNNELGSHSPEFYKMGGVYQPTKIRGFVCKHCHLKVNGNILTAEKSNTEFFKRIKSILSNNQIGNDKNYAFMEFTVPCKEIVKRKTKNNVVHISGHDFKIFKDDCISSVNSVYTCNKCMMQISCDIYGRFFYKGSGVYSTVEKLSESIQSCEEVKMEEALG